MIVCALILCILPKRKIYYFITSYAVMVQYSVPCTY